MNILNMLRAHMTNEALASEPKDLTEEEIKNALAYVLELIKTGHLHRISKIERTQGALNVTCVTALAFLTP